MNIQLISSAPNLPFNSLETQLKYLTHGHKSKSEVGDRADWHQLSILILGEQKQSRQTKRHAQQFCNGTYWVLPLIRIDNYVIPVCCTIWNVSQYQALCDSLCKAKV